MGKKDSAGAVGSDQRFFFSKMRAVAGYPGEFGGIAKPRLSGQPINAAFSRAKRTGLQEAAATGFDKMVLPRLENVAVENHY